MEKKSCIDYKNAKYNIFLRAIKEKRKYKTLREAYHLVYKRFITDNNYETERKFIKKWCFMSKRNINAYTNDIIYYAPQKSINAMLGLQGFWRRLIYAKHIFKGF